MRAINTSTLELHYQRLKEQDFHKHPLAVPIAVFVMLIVVLFAGFVIFNDQEVRASNSNVVILTHDKKREVLPTKAATVGEFLSKAGITLNEGDVVEPAQETPIREDNFRVNVYRARPVMVVDGSEKIFAFIAATTARSVAAQTGASVYPEDRVTSEMQDDFLKDGAIGEKIIIDRAKPTYLNLYGTPVMVRTHARTVEELLKAKNIQLAEGDTVQPDASTPLSPQTQVFVTRAGTKVETVEETIPMQTEYVEEMTLSFGTTAVRQKGAAGKKLVTYQISTINGKEAKRDIIQAIVIQEPVKQIVARGKAINIPADKEAVMAAAGIAPSDYAYVNYIISRESGWNAASRNASSGAYGLCQALPGSKMASVGSDWATNPVTQLKWCSGYAKGRYGSWSAAYNFWVKNHWW